MSFVYALVFLALTHHSSAAFVNKKSDDSCISKITKCKIPANYKITPGIGAHKYISTPRNWNEARKSCITHGGHLAIIRSKAEEGILLSLMKDVGATNVWVGYHNFFANSEWITVLDEPLEGIGYKHWSIGEPNNAKNKQHCAKLMPSGMDDYDCIGTYPFFCKIDLNCKL